MTYRGTVKNGVVLLPADAKLPDGTKVSVEPVNGGESGSVDLRSRGIDPAQAAELRAGLASFTPEWDSAEMSLYDNYDAAKANL